MLKDGLILLVYIGFLFKVKEVLTVIIGSVGLRGNPVTPDGFCVIIECSIVQYYYVY